MNPFFYIQRINLPTFHFDLNVFALLPSCLGKADQVMHWRWVTELREGRGTDVLPLSRQHQRSFCSSLLSPPEFLNWVSRTRNAHFDYMEINTVQDGPWLVSKLRWIRAFCQFWMDSSGCQGMTCGEPHQRSLQGAWGEPAAPMDKNLSFPPPPLQLMHRRWAKKS